MYLREKQNAPYDLYVVALASLVFSLARSCNKLFEKFRILLFDRDNFDSLIISRQI